MLTSVHLQPNNVLYFKEVYPSISGQKDKKIINTDTSDFYHFNSASLVSGSELDIDFEFSQPLNNSTEFRIPRRGYGLLPRPCLFTSKAKDTIYQAGGAMDKAGLSSVFLTGTLPASTDASYEVLAMYTSYINKRIKTKFGQISARRSVDYYDLSVWEYQQRGALHLHICVASASEEFLQEILLLWKIYWIKILSKVEQLSLVPLLSAPDGYRFSFHQIQAPAQRTTSSVTAYLAKYLSKDSSKVIEKSVNLSRSKKQTFFSPGRWFSKSRNVKALISRSSSVYTEDSPIYGNKVMKFMCDRNIPFDLKEIKRPYTDKLSYRLIFPPEYHETISQYMGSLNRQAQPLSDKLTLVSSIYIHGARIFKENFTDFLESIRFFGMPYHGVYDYASFVRKTTSSQKKEAYLYVLWRSGFISASVDFVRNLISLNNLTQLLTCPCFVV